MTEDHIERGVRLELGTLQLQFGRNPNVVDIEKCKEFVPRKSHAGVAGLDRSSRRLLDQANATTRKPGYDTCSFIFGSIIDDENFAHRSGLRQHALDRAGNICCPIAHWNDDTHFHCWIRRRSSVFLTIRSMS